MLCYSAHSPLVYNPSRVGRIKNFRNIKILQKLYTTACRHKFERGHYYLQIHIFNADLPVAPVVRSKQENAYDDSSLVERLDRLQKQYEDLQKKMVSCFGVV